MNRFIFTNICLFFLLYSDDEQISTLSNNSKTPDQSSLSNSSKEPVESKFRYILPRPPLQDINQY